MNILDVAFVPTNQEGVFVIIDREDADRILPYRWHINSTGYAIRARRLSDPPGGAKVRMHCEILSVPDGYQRDHINRNKLDNRKANLREATSRQNKGNIARKRDNTSGFKGVYWAPHAKKWVAEIRFQGKKTHLGYFAQKEDGARAYDAAATRVFGEFASLNFPDFEDAA